MTSIVLMQNGDVNQMAKLPGDTIYHYEYDGKDNINITITDLIRCKDCKRYGRDNCFMKIQMLWELKPDDFCSYAERRGEKE